LDVADLAIDLLRALSSLSSEGAFILAAGVPLSSHGGADDAYDDSDGRCAGTVFGIWRYAEEVQVDAPGYRSKGFYSGQRLRLRVALAELKRGGAATIKKQARLHVALHEPKFVTCRDELRLER
jgi:hypothetical protein